MGYAGMHRICCSALGAFLVRFSFSLSPPSVSFLMGDCVWGVWGVFFFLIVEDSEDVSRSNADAREEGERRNGASLHEETQREAAKE